MYVDEFYAKHISTVKQLPLIQWSNVVIFIIIYESSKVHQLLKGHFKTWLKQADEGLDIVFVTDKSNKRSVEEIYPDAKKVMLISHVYKSQASFDGKHI